MARRCTKLPRQQASRLGQKGIGLIHSSFSLRGSITVVLVHSSHFYFLCELKKKEWFIFVLCLALVLWLMEMLEMMIKNINRI